MLGAFDLEALDGIGVAIDTVGTIKTIGATNWNTFALENGAPDLLDHAVIGKNLFDFVLGSDVHAQLREVMRELSTGTRRAWVMSIRCDAPSCKRNLRQAITPMFSDTNCEGFLLHSIELERRQRPPINLFDFREVEQRAHEETNLPTVVMCSWCQRVKCEKISGEGWLEAEDYYAAGGRSAVRISHGICKLCAETATRSYR
jgi:hypothetical protein